MKVKVSELTSPILDWAVAECEGINLFETEGWIYMDGTRAVFRPTTDWRQGGLIIEREWLEVKPWPNESDEDTRWQAKSYDTLMPTWATGPTPLIAAMRCYVASKLGDEIEVPDGLL